MQNLIETRLLLVEDIPLIVHAFNKLDWQKPHALFEKYLAEQQAQERLIWVAHLENQFAGFVTLLWQSLYTSFREAHIPEIVDLNVLPEFRKVGVGAHLLHVAEKEAAKKSDTVGIGVGLYAGEDGGYGSAQRLYVKCGYIPDGKGVTYHYLPTVPGHSYVLDDELILWFTKKLK
jgi:GNAT superfamily N-acetyltransferase